MTVRPATVEDATAIATVSVETWRLTYGHILPRSLLAGLRVDQRAARVATIIGNGGRYWVADDEGRAVGFVSVGPNKEADIATDAELYAIYVLPDQHGRGVGRSLLRAAVAHLREEGRTSMCVFAFAGNHLARAFYTGLGAREHDRSTYNLDGVDYPDQSYVWDSLDELAARLEPGG